MAKILVCDDDKDIVEAIDIYLTQEGYEVLKAYDGDEAIKVLKRNEVDLLIMDVMMPRLDGIRATLKIRENMSLPIIILSAKSEDADKILGLNIGAEIFLKLIEENKITIAKKLEKDPNFIQSIMNFAIKNSSKILFKDLDKDKKNMLAENRKNASDYNKRLYKQWEKPIDNLETIIEMSHECAEMYCESFIEKAEKEENILFHSLRSIHARALLTSRECLLLLKNGYSDGAFSRWRTLYELSVIGALLFKKNDNDICQRYLDYFHIQAYKEEQLNREKGHPSHTEDSFVILKENYDYVIEKYGKEYAKGEYGWANKMLNKNATFRDIEEAADMRNLRGYYKSSSMFVHGNYKASQESLGLMPNIDKMLLVGPSNYGLSIPMQNVAISQTIICELL